MRLATAIVFVLLTIAAASAACNSTCYVDSNGVQHCRYTCDHH